MTDPLHGGIDNTFVERCFAENAQRMFERQTTTWCLIVKAARVHRFGPPSVIAIDDVPRPEPSAGELLVHVKAAGVGNWDALIREGIVQLQPLPLVLGSELSGIVERVGPDVPEFNAGDEVYGATNAQFAGAYADYALASHRMLAQKPKR